MKILLILVILIQTIGCGNHSFDDILGGISSSAEESSSSEGSSAASSSVGSSSSSSNAASSAASSSSVGSSSSSSYSCPSGVVCGTAKDDRDGKTYRTVEIGAQTWMAENLNINVEGSKCYDDDPANCAKYGRLYDWDAAMRACPSGWHLPSDAEWTALTEYAGGFWAAGDKLKAASGWNSNGSNGTDDFGFAALPGGFFMSDLEGGADFFFVGYDGYWWSSTKYASINVYDAYYCRSMSYGARDPVVRDYFFDNFSLLSVRCLQD